MHRHDWIFDTLSDLRDYALANGLADLARNVEVTLAVARREAAGPEIQIDRKPCRSKGPH